MMRWPLLVCLAFTPLVAGAEPTAKQQSPAVLAANAKQSLAQIEGELKLPGLKEPVEILRDRWGVAHIYAKNTPDLFFAQGFVAAQDRLFQIDVWRRQGTGEMAEVFGPDYAEADRFARLMKYRGDMEEEWRSYSPDAKEIATAFTAGINAAIDQFGEKPPVEFQILGTRPKKWKPEDMLGRMSGIYMSQNFRNEIARARLVAAVGIEKARWLAPVDPSREYTSALSDEELKAIDGRILAGYDAATKALSFKPAKTESNNWVVSGERSVSGKPLLASDPHRATALPSLRYLVHLHAPGWNVIGSGEPALPGVAIGHNDKIAWGFTIVGTDQADFYVEEVNPANTIEYKVGEQWKPMTVVRETIAVKGKAARTVELQYTRHGPVLFQDEKRHRAYALKWVGSDPGGAAYLASLSVGRAKNHEEFLAALGRWKVPGLNFVYADVDGNIGWIAAARTPIRPKHDGLLPVPGNGGYEWSGHLAVSDLPQSYNPKAGWLATANHNIVPKGYPHQIGFEFAPPYRYDRVSYRLSLLRNATLDDFRSIQHDDTSIPGLALAKLLKNLDLKNKSLEIYARLLTEWDGRLGVDSAAGPLYAIWVRVMQQELYASLVPNELVPTMNSLAGMQPFLRALESGGFHWFGAQEKAARDQFLRDTLAKAAAEWEKLPREHKRWGALHTATFRHPLATLDPALAKAFDVGPFERPGNADTPNNTRYDEKFQQIHGATYRHLIDLADWDRTLATSAPGQSGQPGSPHYADLAPLWAKGEYFPLAYSRPKVETVTQHRLTLRP
ncbi:MAG: penicillin acylase family protein [Planctomycetes bacterium]|nr:penicillin acylase family protein [Planctomycetota bacterium]